MGKRAPAVDQPDIEGEPPFPRSMREFREEGLLWLINRAVFHPRGLALAFHFDGEGEVTGWSLIGDGREVWAFESDVDDEGFKRAEQCLRLAAIGGRDG